MTEEKKKVESLQKRIVRGGRILSVVCRVAQAVLAVGFVVCLGMLIAVFIHQDAPKIARWLFEDNALYRLLASMVNLNTMDPVYLSAIGIFAVMITIVALWIYTRMAQGIFAQLAAGEKPLNLEAAKKMRQIAWLMLLTMVYDVPMGLIDFGIVLLFSYIMEYGGYIQERADQTNRIQEEMIVSFAEITENKSGQTGKHVKRVSEYSRILAEQLGLDPQRVEAIRVASMMHDIGKLMIPPEILEKPGRLTDSEYATIKTHTAFGDELLKNVEGEELALSRTIAHEHHERVDGKGYPAHLSGDQISLEGRIVAVADVYDALTSRRSYKEPWTEEDATAEILRGRGTQFDEKVVDAFVQAHDRLVEAMQKYRD